MGRTGGFQDPDVGTRWHGPGLGWKNWEYDGESKSSILGARRRDSESKVWIFTLLLRTNYPDTMVLDRHGLCNILELFRVKRHRSIYLSEGLVPPETSK